MMNRCVWKVLASPLTLYVHWSKRVLGHAKKKM